MKALTYVLIHAGSGARLESGGDIGQESLEAEALGESGLGAASALPLDQEADDESRLGGDHDQRAPDVPSVLLPQRWLSVEHRLLLQVDGGPGRRRGADEGRQVKRQCQGGEETVQGTHPERFDGRNASQ